MSFGSYSCCCDWGFETVYPRPDDCTIPETTHCGQFPSGMVSKWELTVAGVTNVSGNACNLCSIWNGTFILTYDSSPYGVGGHSCTLPGTFQTISIRESGVCVARGGTGWFLAYGQVFPGVWTLEANKAGMSGGNLAVYRMPSSAAIDPFNTNVMDFWFADAENCENWPATITLEPVCE